MAEAFAPQEKKESQMAYLLLAVAMSIFVSVALKTAKTRGVDLAQAIWANYIVCALLTLAVLRPALGSAPGGLNWWLFAPLGILLPTIFIVFGVSVREAGIAKSDAAQRLSLILSILSAFLLFNEPLSARKGVAVALALAALVLLCWPAGAKGLAGLAPSKRASGGGAKRFGQADRTDRAAPAAQSDPSVESAQADRMTQSGPTSPTTSSAQSAPSDRAGQPGALREARAPNAKGSARFKSALLLFGVWAGYGVIDVLLKALSQTNFHLTMLVMFALAFAVMSAWLVVARRALGARSVATGLMIGFFNFFNILFYLKAHQAFKGNPSLVYTGMNIGVIAIGALIGVALFKEKLGKLNWLGLALSVVAILGLFNPGGFLPD